MSEHEHPHEEQQPEGGEPVGPETEPTADAPDAANEPQADNAEGDAHAPDAGVEDHADRPDWEQLQAERGDDEQLARLREQLVADVPEMQPAEVPADEIAPLALLADGDEEADPMVLLDRALSQDGQAAAEADAEREHQLAAVAPEATGDPAQEQGPHTREFEEHVPDVDRPAVERGAEFGSDHPEVELNDDDEPAAPAPTLDAPTQWTVDTRFETVFRRGDGQEEIRLMPEVHGWVRRPVRQGGAPGQRISVAEVIETVPGSERHVFAASRAHVQELDSTAAEAMHTGCGAARQGDERAALDAASVAYETLRIALDLRRELDAAWDAALAREEQG